MYGIDHSEIQEVLGQLSAFHSSPIKCHLIYQQRTLEEHKVQVAQLDRVTEFLRSKLEETQLKLPNEVAELTRKTRTSDSRSSACEKKAGAEKDNLTSISSYSLSSGIFSFLIAPKFNLHLLTYEVFSYFSGSGIDEKKKVD